MKEKNNDILSNSKKRWIVSVGAGTMQLPFIKALKSKGYSIVAFGKGRNDLNSVNLCDYFKEIDTSNSEEAINWLNSLNLDLEGAGSYAGGCAIKTLQDINRYFDLPTNIPEYLSIGMDKFEQQKLYEEYGLTSVKTFRPSEIMDNDSISKINDFIIKPSIGRGSAGVNKVNKTGLYKMIENNALLDTDMVQEFKEGEEYRMLTIVQNSEIKLLAPIKRESFHNSFLLGRLSYNSDKITKIKNYITKMIHKLRLKDAIIKADMIMNDEDINMIEMDIGVGGGSYYKSYISHLSNYDVEGEYIKLITGQEVAEAKDFKNKAIMDYVYNLSGEPILYDHGICITMLSNFLGSKNITLIPNLLQSEDNSKFASNADFIFCIIHDNKTINNMDINDYVNKKVFSKSNGENYES